jgi:hypothetical protein
LEAQWGGGSGGSSTGWRRGREAAAAAALVEEGGGGAGRRDGSGSSRHVASASGPARPRGNEGYYASCVKESWSGLAICSLSSRSRSHPSSPSLAR